MYVRFVVGQEGDSHSNLTGIITEARIRLREQERLTVDEDRRLQECYDWLNENVPVPPYSRRTWPDDVVAWFKDGATEPVGRMWDIVALLRDHDVAVRMLTSANPGRIVYEDRYPIVVKQWNRI